MTPDLIRHCYESKSKQGHYKKDERMRNSAQGLRDLLGKHALIYCMGRFGRNGNANGKIFISGRNT